MALGDAHTCVIGDAGSAVKCFGQNNQGQLGLGLAGLTSNSKGNNPGEMGDSLPNVDLGTGTFIDIGAGQYHNCVVFANGKVKCWGDNADEQLGLGDGDDRGMTPASMGSGLPFLDLGTGVAVERVSAGWTHTCVLLSDRRVKCWGKNSDGQLGLGDGVSRGDVPSDMGDNLPFVDLGAGHTATMLCSGETHTCAILDNSSIKCWGTNAHGELGLGDTAGRGETSATMGDGLPVVDLGTGRTARFCSAGKDYTCAVLDDWSIKCWGDNLNGQLGLGDSDARGKDSADMGGNLPAVDLNGDTALEVYCGREHTCARISGGSVKCWGDNQDGQLGLGDSNDRGDGGGEMGANLPAADLGPGLKAERLALGYRFSCSVFDGGTMKCWGKGYSGQIGTGNNADYGASSSTIGTNLPVVDLGTCQPSVAPTPVPFSPPTAPPSAAPSLAPTAPPNQPTNPPTAPPTAAPSGAPSVPPTAAPSKEPSAPPSASPSTSPSAAPSGLPTLVPTQAPSALPTRAPSSPPSVLPTAAPTQPPMTGPTQSPSTTPTQAPSAPPSPAPSGTPSSPPSAVPSASPTATPSGLPSHTPTQAPSSAPSATPSGLPSANPSRAPTTAPSASPSGLPSVNPTAAPSAAPSLGPSTGPSSLPTGLPSGAPSAAPAAGPSAAPSRSPTGRPSLIPTAVPSGSPTRLPSGTPSLPPSAVPSAEPSLAPSTGPSELPSRRPSAGPSEPPTAGPSSPPSANPVAAPTFSPTATPSAGPSLAPSTGPSELPTRGPSVSPSEPPTAAPSSLPSANPSGTPSASPTAAPSAGPSASPSTSPSGLPSTGPSQQPSAAPSPGPTQLPSSAPTASPSARPSTDPTLNPSASPTAAPSGVPSTPPSPGPTTDPTAAPSGMPSESPTLAPSSVPSVHPSAGPSSPPTLPPTQIPSAPPSPAPESPPSVPPSGAPSRLPSSPPSSTPSALPSVGPTPSPSNGSTVPPSYAPSAPPTVGPTRAPTPAPLPTATVAVAGGTADTAGAVSLAAGSAPAAAQAGRLTVVTQGCSVKEADGAAHDEALPLIFHPTGLELAGAAHPVFVGCIVANTAIIAAVTALALGGSAAAAAVLKRERWQVQGMLRIPTVPVLCAAVFMQGPVYAGSKLLRTASSPGDAILAVIGVLIGICMPLLMLREGRRSQEQAVYKLDPDARTGCSRAWLGPGEWLSLRQARVERWGVSFRAMMPGFYFLTAVDTLTTTFALASAGLGGGGCASCGVMRLLDAAIAVALTAYALWKKPYARPLRLPIIVAAQLLLAGASLALSIGYFSADCGSDPPPNADIAGVLLAASGMVMLAAVALDCTCVLRGIQLGRRNGLIRALAEFERLDAGGTGELTRERLREWMLSHRSMTDEEFDRVFRTIDEDGSGTVSIHEFIRNEEHFWEAAEGSSAHLLESRGYDSGEAQLAGKLSLLSVGSTRGAASGRSSPRGRARTGSPSRTGSHRSRLRRAVVVQGAGVDALNGEYYAVRQHSSTSSVGVLRRFRSRAGHSVVREAGGAWRIELYGRESYGRAGRGSQSFRQLPKSFSGSARGSMASASSDALSVAYFHPGGSPRDDSPPADGWSIGPRGMAPTPEVAIKLLELSELDRHNLGAVPGGSFAQGTPGRVSAMSVSGLDDDLCSSMLPETLSRTHSPLASSLKTSRLRRQLPQRMNSTNVLSPQQRLRPSWASRSTPTGEKPASPTGSRRRRRGPSPPAGAELAAIPVQNASTTSGAM